jgi:hypothetical protein
MIPSYYDLEPAYRDDDYGPVFIRVQDHDSPGQYLDFSLCSDITLQVRNKKNKALVLKWSFSAGEISIADDFFIMLAKKSHVEMAMPGGEYIYDLQVVLNGSHITYMVGKLKVFEDITRI